MARLAMTETMVDAIRLCNSSSIKGWPPEAVDGEPSLEDAAEGRPISYGQVIEISDILRRHNDEHEAQDVKTKDGEFKYDLNALLKGSRVYAEPSEPKDPKTTKYGELMARLRRQEEDRSYEKLLKPGSSTGSNGWLAARTSTDPKNGEDDETTFSDVNRQIALVANFLLSIVACAYALWVVARSWSTPRRLALSMAGAIAVGVAEVVVYTGYLRRTQEARQKSKKHVEKKEIMETWVISKRAPESKDEPSAPVTEAKKIEKPLRKRKNAK